MNQEQKITLGNYINNQNTFEYYKNTKERYLLAREFMYAYNDEVYKNTSIYRNMTPFMNPDNIELMKIDSDEDDYKYWISFPNRFSSANDLYQNFAFGDSRLFNYKDHDGKIKSSTNGMVVGINKRRRNYLLKTLSNLLFYIYFGYHPFCGRLYYNSLDVSIINNKRFFINKPKFIFDLDNNSNRFINGYHDFAWQLWNQTSIEQKEFWLAALNNKYSDYEQFFKAWEKVYDCFELVKVNTLCGETIDTLVFSDKYTLMISKNKISANSISCYKCNNQVECDNCSFGYPIVKITKTKIQIINNEENKNMIIYPKKIIMLDELIKTEKHNPCFEVVQSKKINDLLGLKVLNDKTIIVTCDKNEKTYTRDDVIPLLANVSIAISDNCKIIVLN